MEIRSTPPSPLFHATASGAGIDAEHRCGHGSPALVLDFIKEDSDSTEQLGVLLPACVAPGLFGAALAVIATTGGPDAAAGFLRRMFATYHEASRTITASGRACCEAGSITAGREHTCGRDSVTPTV